MSWFKLEKTLRNKNILIRTYEKHYLKKKKIINNISSK